MVINGFYVPETWEKYPNSFLVAALPILSTEKTFPKTWHKLAEIGLTGLLKVGGCPEISSFTPIKVNMRTIIYSYGIKANPRLDYFITLSIFNTKGKFLTSDFFAGLKQTNKEIKSLDDEIGSIKLSVRATGIDNVVDTRVVTFKDTQPMLLQSF